MLTVMKEESGLVIAYVIGPHDPTDSVKDRIFIVISGASILYV
jgi:hypothetical protein